MHLSISSIRRANSFFSGERPRTNRGLRLTGASTRRGPSLILLACLERATSGRRPSTKVGSSVMNPCVMEQQAPTYPPPPKKKRNRGTKADRGSRGNTGHWGSPATALLPSMTKNYAQMTVFHIHRRLKWCQGR